MNTAKKIVNKSSITVTRDRAIASFYMIVMLSMFYSPMTLYAQTNQNWTQVNLSVTDNYVIPAYERFSRASSELKESATSFCKDSNNLNYDALLGSYHSSMDAWESIQHIQFGPVTYFNWNFRLQYWPDDNGTGGRQLTALIASKDQDVLLPDNFSGPGTSIGVQGFPALERLLFADDSLEGLTADPYRCEVVEAIADNISTIAAGISERWKEEFRETVASADDRGFFESSEDATIDFLKSLVESVPRLQEQKLIPVLGDSIASARVRRAESWRSSRSLRNLKINVSMLSELFNGDAEIKLNSVLEVDDIDAVNLAFFQLEHDLSVLPDSLEEALQSEEHYLVMQNLILLLEDLDDALENGLKNTDLYLGFNSLDGD